VTIQLAPSGEGTRVDVTTDLSVTGKPAQFGRGVMQDVSDKLLGQFVACIENQFAVEDEPEPPPEPVPDAVSPAPSAGAGDTGGTGGDTASGGGGTASGGAPEVLAPAASRPSGRSTPRLTPVPAVDDSIDLGATVLPVLLKTYAPHAVAGLIGVLIGWLLGRRRSS
jgi:uncharacterized protein